MAARGNAPRKGMQARDENRCLTRSREGGPWDGFWISGVSGHVWSVVCDMARNADGQWGLLGCGWAVRAHCKVAPALGSRPRRTPLLLLLVGFPSKHARRGCPARLRPTLINTASDRCSTFLGGTTQYRDPALRATCPWNSNLGAVPPNRREGGPGVANSARSYRHIEDHQRRQIHPIFTRMVEDMEHWVERITGSSAGLQFFSEPVARLY